MSSESKFETPSKSDQTASLLELHHHDVAKMENNELNDAASSHGPQADALKYSSRVPEASVGGAACVHAGKEVLELSAEKLHCECQGAEGTELVPSAENEIGIVLPSSYRHFALNFRSATGSTPSNDDSESIAVVGLLQSGRIILAPFDSLKKSQKMFENIFTQNHVVEFASMISESCAECHRCGDDNLTSEEMTQKFVSRMQKCDKMLFADFESIFIRICEVCFDHRLEESHRSFFLQAIRCVCNFKSFKARLMTGKGKLALVSLLHSCQSCMSAELALECIYILGPHSAQVTDAICPIVIEAMLSLVRTHDAAASKFITTLEQWFVFKRVRKNLIGSSVLIRLATLMRAFQDIHAVSSSVRLLHSIMATDSRKLLPFIENPSFCLVLSHLSSTVSADASADPTIAESVLFSFWKGLDLLFLHAASTGDVKKPFLETMLQLAQECQCSNRSSNQILCARSFCMVADMFPDTMFVDCTEINQLHKNQAVKQIVLKLMQGICDNIALHSICVTLCDPDVALLSDRSPVAVYFCSRLSSSLVGSLIGLREMTKDSIVASTLQTLVEVGEESGVCVCPARKNLGLLQETMGRKILIDQWAPAISADMIGTGADVCPMCLDPLIDHQIIRQIRCPGNHVFCAKCIENWLVYKQHESCPICRHNCTL